MMSILEFVRGRRPSAHRFATVRAPFVRGDLDRMYFVTVTLLTFVLPVASILLDHAMSATAVSWFALIGKWFVFWSAGVRLILAAYANSISRGLQQETSSD